MRSVLIVDDSPPVRLMLKEAVRRACGDQTRIHEAFDRPSAIAEFAAHDVDVVFLDMMIEDEADGVSALREILAAKPDAKVAIVTSLPRENGAVTKAISLGAWVFLPKPVRAKDIAAVMNQFEVDSGRMTRIH